MAQIYGPNLNDVAYAARAGSAGRAARENAQFAVQADQHQQQIQLHADQIDTNQENRQEDRVAQLKADTITAQQRTLQAQQEAAAAVQKNELDHKQAKEIQAVGQEHAWQMEQSKSMDEDIGTIQKQLATMKLTPEGRRLAGTQMQKLRGLRAARDGGYFRTPSEYNSNMAKWLKETAEAGIEAHEIKVPGPDEDYGIKTKQVGDQVHQVVYDTKGNPRWEPIEQPKKEKDKGALVPAHEYFADPAVYDREEKASRERIMEAKIREHVLAGKGTKGEGDKKERKTTEEIMDELKPPTSAELWEDMQARKRERDARLVDAANPRTAAPTAVIPPVAPAVPEPAPVASAPDPAAPAPVAPTAPIPVPVPSASGQLVGHAPDGTEIRNADIAPPPVGQPPSALAPPAPAPEEKRKTVREMLQEKPQEPSSAETPIVRPEPANEDEAAAEATFDHATSTAESFQGSYNFPGSGMDLHNDMKLISQSVGKHGWDTNKWPKSEYDRVETTLSAIDELDKYKNGDASKGRPPQTPMPLPEKKKKDGEFEFDKDGLVRGRVYGPLTQKDGKKYDAVWTGKKMAMIGVYIPEEKTQPKKRYQDPKRNY